MGSHEPDVRPEILQLKRYIPGKPIDEVVRELGLSRVVKLASNENPLGPSPLALQAVVSAAPSMQLYPDDVAFALRRSLAAHYRLDENQIILGNGAVEIIRMLVEVFIRPGDEAVVGDPSFAIYREDVKQMGGKLVEVPLDSSYHYDLAGMERAVNPKTRMVIFCSPNNPTGTTLKRDDLERFLRHVPSGVFVVLDEAYGDFAQDPDYHDGIAWVKRGYPVIVLRTFSKAYGLAGIRVGYGAADPAVVRYLGQVRVLFNVNSLAQTAAAAALQDREHYERTRKLIWEEKEFIYRELDRLGVRFVPTESNFFVIAVGDDREVFESLLHQGVIVRPGSNLGMPGWLRVTIGTHEENLLFARALEKTVGKSKV